MRVRTVMLVWVLAGCGELVAAKSDAQLPDARFSDAQLPDGVPDGAPSTMCDPLGKFSTPVAVAGLTTFDEATGSLSPDELTIYVQTSTSSLGRYDVKSATRSSLSGSFGSLTDLANVNGAANEGNPWVSADGLTLLFTTDRDGVFQIYAAARASTLVAFGAPAVLAGIQSTAENDAHGFETADGQELWFMSDRSGGIGGRDIWRATKSGSGFANPINMASVSSASTDQTPILSADKLTIYFSSNRSGGAGNCDIWRATRSSTSDGFGTPVPVTEVNSTADDYSPWLSADGCRLYLSSGRDGPSNIYVATRKP